MTLLQLEEIDSIEKLEEIKKETSRKKGVSLMTEYPEIAITLKLLYNKNELFMELLKVFEKQKRKELSFKELVEEIVKNKPNLFINLFCPKNKKEEVLRMYQKGEEKSIYEEERVLRETITHSPSLHFLEISDISGNIINRKCSAHRKITRIRSRKGFMEISIEISNL